MPVVLSQILSLLEKMIQENTENISNFRSKMFRIFGQPLTIALNDTLHGIDLTLKIRYSVQNSILISNIALKSMLQIFPLSSVIRHMSHLCL